MLSAPRPHARLPGDCDCRVTCVGKDQLCSSCTVQTASMHAHSQLTWYDSLSWGPACQPYHTRYVATSTSLRRVGCKCQRHCGTLKEGFLHLSHNSRRKHPRAEPRKWQRQRDRGRPCTPLAPLPDQALVPGRRCLPPNGRRRLCGRCTARPNGQAVLGGLPSRGLQAGQVLWPVRAMLRPFIKGVRGM